MLPLDGLRVVEFGRTCMASYCARLLADGGADVIKIEPPEGDAARRRGPFPNDVPSQHRSGLFHGLNVNKRSVVLDAKTPRGRAALTQLLDTAHVLVSDLPQREAGSVGLTRRRLARSHPHLLVTSITPFGESGPYRDFQANEHVVYNMSGLAFATPGLPDHVDDPNKEPPLRPSTPISELIAGAVGATATLFAVISWTRDGLGRHVEVSAQEAVASMLYRDVVAYSYIRLITGRRPVQVALMPNAVMPCKDGFVILAVPYDHMWKPFASIMGSPDWAEWEVFKDTTSRAVNWDALYPLLLEWTMRHTGDEIMRMAQSEGIPCFPAYTLGDVVNSTHERERGYFWPVRLNDSSTAKVPGSPSSFRVLPSGCASHHRVWESTQTESYHESAS